MSAKRGGAPRSGVSAKRGGAPRPGESGPRSGESGQIEGRRAVVEALRAGRHVDEIVLASGMRPAGVIAEIVRLAKRSGVRVREVPRRDLETMSRTRNPQGVVAVASGFRYSTLEEVLERVERSAAPALLVALDQITDPQNLGAIARAAEGAGAHGLIVGKRRAAGVTPAAEKASAGALEHLPVAQVPNLVRALDELKERGIWVLALDAEAPASIYEADVRDPVCLVVGSEGSGVSRLVREHADHLVSIPMSGRVESLNAATASAVTLFEIRRRRSA